MNSHLNLIGTIVIAGLLFLTINRFNSSMNENTKEIVLDSITSENTSTITKLIEFDFNRMGLGVPQTTPTLILADSNRITFLSDIDGNRTIDQIRYILSDVNTANGTENPNDRILYRLLNGQPQQDAALGVTEFRIRYFDSLGNETTNLPDIRTFEITLEVESIVPYNNRYSTFYWQTTITPPNLLRF